MRLAASLRALLAAFALPACTNATSPLDPACPDTTGLPATLVITTEPDFSGMVSKSEFEGGISPEGPMSQYDVWITVPPSSTANAGVVVGRSVPVFLRSDASGLATACGKAIRAGDRIDVWRVPVLVAYGTVEGPPGAPVYEGTQIVINRP
jgi:hypothetical protein